MNAVVAGAATVVLSFIAMVIIMVTSKKYEPTGSLIVLKTANYIVIAGLAMMLIGFLAAIL